MDEAHCVSQWGEPVLSSPDIIDHLILSCEVILTGASRRARILASSRKCVLTASFACCAGHDFRPDYKGLSVFKRR